MTIWYFDWPGKVVSRPVATTSIPSSGWVASRAGRIAGSTNVPSSTLLDPQTNAFRPAAEIEAALRAAGAMEAGRVVPYCGGGIAASVTAYWLTRLGRENVALYDASLSEWVTDESLPMEVG